MLMCLYYGWHKKENTLISIVVHGKTNTRKLTEKMLKAIYK